jgi:hypothetical protein
MKSIFQKGNLMTSSLRFMDHKKGGMSEGGFSDSSRHSKLLKSKVR